MSFDKRKEFIEEGDTIVLFLGRQNLISLEVDSSKTHQTKFGAFPHRKFIGRKYGAKVHSNQGRGWLYVLHPDPESWTVSLPHRTQILYTTDISLITFHLELKPGSIVVESGTGSGSLSHAIIRTIKPDGHLFTYDFHENRVLKAREEFDKHGIGSYVTSTCADACSDGFSMTDKADAVFLDLPAPWDAIPHAKKALKKTGGRICSFSPCIEQVQRTCDALRKSQFCAIQTMECLVRYMSVLTTPIPEMIFDSNIKPDFTDKVEVKKAKIDPELQQTEVSINTDATKAVNEVNVEGNVDLHEVVTNSVDTMTKEEAVSNSVDIKLKEEVPSNSVTEIAVSHKELNGDAITGLNSCNMVTKLIAKPKKGNINVLTSKPRKEMAGHTGYLTFASLLPFNIEGETT